MESWMGSLQYTDFLNLASVFLNVGTMLQDKWLHEDSKVRQQRQHLEQVNTERMCNLQQLETELRSQIQSLGTDLTLAGKEAERDMWEQRNTQFQTLMLAATVMFGGGLAVITQGTMPQDSPRPYLLLYSASLAGGFGMLFISIIASMAILKRMCKYMYCRARNHRVNFSTILDKAMAMVEAFDRHGHMKNDISPLPYHGGMAESITHEYGLFIQDMIKQLRSAKERENLLPPASTTAPRNPRSSFLFPPHPHPQPSDELTVDNNAMPIPRPVIMSEAETSTMSFPDFWDTYCKASAGVATNLFYAGTLALLVSVTTMTTCQLAEEFRSVESAAVFAVVCTLCSFVALYYHVKHSDTKGLRRPDFMSAPRDWLVRQMSVESPLRGAQRSMSARMRSRVLRRQSSSSSGDNSSNGNGNGDGSGNGANGGATGGAVEEERDLQEDFVANLMEEGRRGGAGGGGHSTTHSPRDRGGVIGEGEDGRPRRRSMVL